MVSSVIPPSVEFIQPFERDWINEVLFNVLTLELLKNILSRIFSTFSKTDVTTRVRIYTSVRIITIIEVISCKT